MVERNEKCQYCGKQLSKSGLRLHEKYCRQNPLKDLNKEISATKVESVENLANDINQLNDNSELIGLRTENLTKKETLISKKIDAELQKFPDIQPSTLDGLKKTIKDQIEFRWLTKMLNQGELENDGKLKGEVDILNKKISDMEQERVLDSKIDMIKREFDLKFGVIQAGLEKIGRSSETNIADQLATLSKTVEAVRKINFGGKEKKDSAELVADLIERTISSPGVSGMLQELGKAASEKIRSPGSVNSSPKQEIQEIKTLTSNEIEQLDPQQLEYYNKFGSLPSSSGSEIEESASISHVSLSDPLTENPELNKYEEITEFVEVPKTIMEKVPVQITRKKEKPIEFSDLTNLSIQRD